MREQAEHRIVSDQRVRGLGHRKALLCLLPRRRARRGTWCTIGAIINVGMGPASREMEDLLESHPKAHEVVIIGVPTAYGDEKGKAAIVANSPCTAEEIVLYCRGKIADLRSAV
jgi:hypothetical protein